MMGNGVEEIFNNLSDLDKARLINYLLHSMYRPVFISAGADIFKGIRYDEVFYIETGKLGDIEE